MTILVLTKNPLGLSIVLILTIAMGYLLCFVVSFFIMIVVKLFIREKPEIRGELLNEMEYGDYVQWAAVNGKTLFFSKAEPWKFSAIKIQYSKIFYVRR